MGCRQGLRALIILTILKGYTSKVTFPIDSSSDNSLKYVRSLEVTDSSENDIFSAQRKISDVDRWNGWNFENEKQFVDPDEKTISVQLLDEDPYHHGRPAWPHDEYVLGLLDLNRTPQDSNNGTSDVEIENVENTNEENLSKYYEWKRLPPRPSPSAFIGPGFYDVGSSSNTYDSDAVSFPPTPYYRYQHQHQHTNKRITTSDGTGKATSSSSSNSESVPGTASESTTNTRHFPYVPHDYYKRKRLRLQIHPGLIAAPLAGLAAFGAASALTSKPLLLELGYVRNKPDLIGGAGGGWGWVGNVGTGYRPYPPFYPPPNAPPIYPPVGTAALAPGGGFGHGHASSLGPVYPILKPTRGRPEADRGSSWWNPFSALTPRFVIGE